jgi:hypothetical protein
MVFERIGMLWVVILLTLACSEVGSAVDTAANMEARMARFMASNGEGWLDNVEKRELTGRETLLYAIVHILYFYSIPRWKQNKLGFPALFHPIPSLTCLTSRSFVF